MSNKKENKRANFMNITEYTQLMNKPNAVSELQTIDWKSIG
jgi:hypothetical protein